MKIQDMLSTGIGVLLVPKGRGVGGQHRTELLEEDERERTTPIVAFEYGFLTGKCSERKGPTAYSFSFIVGFIKDLGFRRIIKKCDNEPSTKALQDAVIHACVGVEVIPQGPPEGNHMDGCERSETTVQNSANFL